MSIYRPGIQMNKGSWLFGGTVLGLALWVVLFVYWGTVHEDLIWLQRSMHYGSPAEHLRVAEHSGPLGAMESVVEALITGGASPQIGAVIDNAEGEESKKSAALRKEKFSEEDLVNEVLHDLPPEERGERDEWKDKVGLHDKVDLKNKSHVLAQKTKDNGGEPSVHIIYSTDCSAYQNWQSITLYYSALLCGQQGVVTRIASGCSSEEAEELHQTYKKVFPENYRVGLEGGAGDDGLTFRVHFTPDFKHDATTNKKYAFYNKPRGTQHWLDNAVPAIPADEVVALLDPDMILLRPLTARIRDHPNKLYNKDNYVNKKTGEMVQEMQQYVVTGKPVAQMYGLGAPWTNDNHKKFNRRKICPVSSPCLKVENVFGEQHYSVGPPYIATRADFDRITKSWVDLVPRVFAQYPYLLAEMYAYSMAAAHENLPHAQFYHYMVSNTEGGGEGWDYIDDLDEVCGAPQVPKKGSVPHMRIGGVNVEHFFADKPMPVLFHYCQHFRITDELGFYKGAHRDKDSMSCETKQQPMCEPGTAGKGINYKQHKRGTDIYKSTRKKKRGGFAVNLIHTVYNRAIRRYQERMCKST